MLFRFVKNPIAGGATALGFFTNGGPTRPLEPFSVPPANRTAVAQVTTEISDLAGVLLSPQVPAAEASAPICVGARDVGGRTWVIAANPTPERVSATISVPGFREGKAGVWDEVRTVPVHGGSLVDTFDPLAVHVYELNGPTLASPAPTSADEPQPMRRRRRR